MPLTSPLASTFPPPVLPVPVPILLDKYNNGTWYRYLRSRKEQQHQVKTIRHAPPLSVPSNHRQSNIAQYTTEMREGTMAEGIAAPTTVTRSILTVLVPGLVAVTPWLLALVQHTQATFGFDKRFNNGTWYRYSMGQRFPFNRKA